MSKALSTLFVASPEINHIGETLNLYRDFFINVYFCSDLKTKDKALQKAECISILKKAQDQNLKLIFFLGNSFFIPYLVYYRKKLGLEEIEIIAWHQKHYFKATFVSKLKYIIEYSLETAKRQREFCQKHENKYIHLPYPCSLASPDNTTADENFKNLLISNKRFWDDANSTPFPYVFISGRNNRDMPSIKRVARKLPHINFIYAVGMEGGMQISTTDNPPNKKIQQEIVTDHFGFDNFAPVSDLPNLLLIHDLSPQNWKYLMSQCKIHFLPITAGRKGVPICSGHSTLAGAIFYGKITITTKSSSLEENIHDKKNGFLAKVGDWKGYATFIQAMFSDKKTYDSMSKYCKKTKGRASMRRFITNIKEKVFK